MMNRQAGGARKASRWLLAAVVALAMPVLAQQGRLDAEPLLDESEYRSELEEVVIVGQAPEWRKAPPQPEWRPERFKLSAPSSESRLQWFPEYRKDERDNYQGVRDRTGEKAEFKIFQWKF